MLHCVQPQHKGEKICRKSKDMGLEETDEGTDPNKGKSMEEMDKRGEK